jgi:hypothetical protein
MMTLHALILLRAIFNEELNNAVLAKDADKVIALIYPEYSADVAVGYITDGTLDIEKLHADHTYQLEHDDFEWAK